ncbi:copper amine oxidase N-terminal domain-containing protein [Paenibacillus pinisoli]|nr:copper amine oxidase N-terminal domain-containing protein [Paenibacillus pinisoli]
MKQSKWVLALMLSVALMATVWPGEADAAGKPVTVTHNNGEVELQNPPILQNGTTQLPLREIGNLLNSKTTWIPEGKRIVITNPQARIELALGSKQAKVNGKNVELRTVPYNKNGVVYVPVRFISEAFGAQVDWHEKERRVNITMETKYIYTTQDATSYWLEKTNGKLYSASNADSAKLIADTKAEVLGSSEFTVESLSANVHVLQVYDSFGEPGFNNVIYKLVIANQKLTLETRTFYYWHPNNNIERSANNNALLIDGATLYEMNLEGELVGKHDLKALTGYEDKDYQVEWFDDNYMVVRPERTGWLTLVDRNTKETTLLAEAVLDEETWGIFQSLEKIGYEFSRWDGLKVVEIKDNKLILAHYLFIDNVITQYVFDLSNQ